MVSGMNSRFNFDTDSNEFLFSPALANRIKSFDLINKLNELKLDSHFFILSSGTTQSSSLKGYALSKKSVLANAKAVNEHLGLSAQDTWLSSLPYYHIGGLSIYARSFLSGASVIENEDKWDASLFYKKIESGIQLASVVPTQCYDLVKAKLKAPKCLKYLIVGGDYLNDLLYQDLIKLNWPVIRTFGMTEVCSQLATERYVTKGDLELEALSIHQVSTLEDKRLKISSSSLFTGMFLVNENKFEYTALEENHFLASDKVEIKNNFLFPQGRVDQDIKVKGRRVDLFELKKQMNKFFYSFDLTNSAQFKLVSDVRDGIKLEIHSLHEIPNATRLQLAQALKPLSIDSYKVVAQLSRTELGKDKN